MGTLSLLPAGTAAQGCWRSRSTLVPQPHRPTSLGLRPLPVLQVCPGPREEHSAPVFLPLLGSKGSASYKGGSSWFKPHRLSINQPCWTFVLKRRNAGVFQTHRGHLLSWYLLQATLVAEQRPSISSKRFFSIKSKTREALQLALPAASSPSLRPTRSKRLPSTCRRPPNVRPCGDGP